MGKEGKKVPPPVTISMSVVVTLLYMSFVYRTWANIEQLTQLVPSFLATGIAVGLFLSVLPLKNPLRFSFFVSAAAPFLSFIVFLFLSLFIPTSVAGDPGFTEEDLWLTLAWFVAISILFGFVAMFGCYLGLRIRKQIKQAYLTFYVEGNNATQSVELRAAQIGAIMTLAASVLSALVSLSVAFIN